MKADLSEFHSISLDKIKADAELPFPLYLYLKLNHRLVPICNEKDPLSAKYSKFQSFKLQELWTPISYYDRFKKILELKPKTEETQLVKDLLTSDLPQEVKAQALTALSQDLLSNLHKITSTSEKEKEEGLKKCSEIADEILEVAAAHDSIYDEVLTMRQTKEEIEHSVAVGSLAAMFAMSIGISDECALADIIMAAIFHDIGLVYVEGSVRQKSENERNKSEEKEYQTHVAKSLEVLRKAKSGISERVFCMVEQHHENYDGSGYPKALMGEQITDFSQVLNMANWFDNLTLGDTTGAAISPADALDQIYESATAERSRITPSILEQVFQYMADQKSAFEERKAEMAKKVSSEAEKLKNSA